MNIKQAVEQATVKLSANCDSASLDARVLTCYAADVTQTKLITEPDRELSLEDQNVLAAYIERRANGEPLAYIVGEKEFWSLTFKVNKHVLIPRPETELLVELALKQIENKKSASILDLGTGSGAIAIAIAKQRPDCRLTATDFCQQALQVAEQNAQIHNTNINFIQSDWYKEIRTSKFDLIISNPPYIDRNDPHLDKYVYQYEPRNALISENDGLSDLDRIINGAKNYLGQSGCLFIEHGFQQADSVQKLFLNAGFNAVQSHKDLSGILRCSSGCI